VPLDTNSSHKKNSGTDHMFDHCPEEVTRGLISGHLQIYNIKHLTEHVFLCREFPAILAPNPANY